MEIAESFAFLIIHVTAKSAVLIVALALIELLFKPHFSASHRAAMWAIGFIAIALLPFTHNLPAPKNAPWAAPNKSSRSQPFSDTFVDGRLQADINSAEQTTRGR